MTAKHSPNASETNTQGRARYGIIVLAATALAMTFEALAQEPMQAVFKARELNFFYRTPSSGFPCHELPGRVATILRAVGARDDIQVRVTSCDDFFGSRDDSLDRSDPFERADPRDRRADPFDTRNDPFRRADRMGNRRAAREQTAHVHVRLMTPVEVTPQVLAEIDKDKSRRELISRVTGNPMAAMNDAIVFPAQRQPVTLSRRTMRLEPEDCELLEEMSKSVFRKIDVRVVRGVTNCNGSRIAPQLTVEALLPVAVTQRQPTIGQGEPDPAATTPQAEPSGTTAEPAQQ